MDTRDLEKIDDFLRLVGQASLFEYYGISPGTDPDEVDAQIRKKRTWAQAQQANPKFRDIALWLIKNNALVRHVLLEELDAYAASIRERERSHKLEMLGLFVRGSLVEGGLTSTVESAIIRQGQELGLSEDEVNRYLRQELGLSREPQEDLLEEITRDFPGVGSEVPDHYAVLKVDPDATPQQLETAYRNRYRWARSLRDKERASQIYRELDEAWKHLGDPRARDRYDQRVRRRMRERTRAAHEPPRIHQRPPGGSSSSVGRYRSTRRGGSPPNGSHAAPPSEDPAPPPAAVSQEPEGAEGAPPLSDTGPVSSSPTGPAEDPAPRNAPSPSTLAAASKGPPRRGKPPPDAEQDAPEASLRVEGPRELEVEAFFRVQKQEYAIHRDGAGPLSVELVPSHPWLEVDETRFQVGAQPRSVELRIRPTLAIGRHSTARLYVRSSHGESRVIQVRLRKPNVLPLFGAVLFMAALGGGVGTWLGGALTGLGLPPPGTTASGPGTTLRLWVDPPAQAVFVDGQLVGSGSTLTLSDPAPGGRVFELRVETGGFSTWQEELLIPPGEETSRRIELELKDPMDFRPGEDDIAADLSRERIRAILSEREAAIERCFHEASTAPAEQSLRVRIRAWIRSRGTVGSVDFLETTPPVQVPESCVERQLRALQFPLLEGDYAVFEHTFDVSPAPEERP